MKFDTVLVRGGAGRLGRCVVAELTGHCRVHVLDRDHRTSPPLSPDRRPLYLPIAEAHPRRPGSPYGLGKQLDEGIAQSLARRGRVAVVCLQPPLVIFPEV